MTKYWAYFQVEVAVETDLGSDYVEELAFDQLNINDVYCVAVEEAGDDE